MSGASSLGAATLSGKGTDGKALTAVTVEVDKAAVSRRSVKVLLKPTVDAKDATKKTANYLVGGATYTLTLANVPTPRTATGQWGQVRVTVGGSAAGKGGLAASYT